MEGFQPSRKEKPVVDYSFCLVIGFGGAHSATKPKHKHKHKLKLTNSYRERKMGVVVGGVILDSSVVLANSPPQHENPSLQPALDSLLRKLRHSKIPAVMIFSLSFLQLHCSFCNILLLPFWVFFD